MGLTERATFLLIGGGIGFILGYIVARLREIKEELDEVVAMEHKRDEEGAMEITFTKVCALIAVLLTAFAAFSSQRAANNSNDTSGQVVALALCNQEFLSKTISALNDRTQYSSTQATANVNLQKSQAAFFSLLLGKPPAPEKERVNAAESYLEDLTNFVRISEKQASAVSTNPYPTTEELTQCLEKREKEQAK